MAEAAPTVLELKGITKEFPGILANDHIDFDLARGEVHALLGENGAGKSTLMNILYGLYSPDEGEILVKGKHVRFSGPGDAIDAGIGMVHQHFMLVPVMSVAENIVLATEPKRAGILLDYDAADRRVKELAAAFRFKIDPEGPDREHQRRAAAARRDPEGALPRSRRPDPGRADRRPDAAGGARALRDPAKPHARGDVRDLHHAQAERGAGDRRPDHRPAAREEDRDGPEAGRDRGSARAPDGRA